MGRPKGSKNKKTVDKEAKQRAIYDMVCAELKPMVHAQLVHAKGIDHFFLRNEKTKQFERVTNPKMIEAALNAGDRDSYYWIFTKDPSVQAFTDLMNRAFGKPPEQVQHTGEDGGPVEHVFRWRK